MTAFELIESIFSRPQAGVAPNRRAITPRQADYLRSLIDKDEDGGAVSAGPNGALVWAPKGIYRYVIEENHQTHRFSLMRLRSAAPIGAGGLF